MHRAFVREVIAGFLVLCAYDTGREGYVGTGNGKCLEAIEKELCRLTGCQRSRGILHLHRFAVTQQLYRIVLYLFCTTVFYRNGTIKVLSGSTHPSDTTDDGRKS